MKVAFLIVLLLIPVGCATPYGPIGQSGGYYSVKLQEDVYRVGFNGNGFTDYARAQECALLRAAEIGATLGFSHFAVEGRSDASTTTMVDMGSTSSTSGYASSFGTFNATTTTRSNTMAVFRPRVELLVHYFHGPPAGTFLELHESQAVLSELGSKYETTAP